MNRPRMEDWATIGDFFDLHNADEEQWDAIDNLQRSLAYWYSRCLAAEDYIEDNQFDPSVYPETMAAYSKWQNLVHQ